MYSNDLSKFSIQVNILGKNVNQLEALSALVHILSSQLL